jgi:hypothetical protein
MKITVKHYDIGIEVNLPEDCSMDDLFNTFAGIVTIMGWSELSWQEKVIQMGKIYQHDLEINK